MLSKKLKQILALAKKTGDRVVIFDGSDEDNSYLITPLDKYLEDDSRDINEEAEKESLESKVVKNLDSDEEDKKLDFKGESAKEESLTEEDLTDKINQEISMWKNQNEVNLLKEEESRKKSWQIPPSVKNKAHNIE